MARQARRPGGRGAAGGARRRSGSADRGNGVRPPARRSPKTAPLAASDQAITDDDSPRTFRLGAIEGATPGRWIDTWKQRMPHVSLDLVPIELSAQRSALDGVDAAIVRLPLDDDSLHVIRLYDEVAVVVASAESHLLAAEELTVDDLAGEVVIALIDDPFGAIELPRTTRAAFAPLSASDAIATAASGVGVVIVPMSIARLHHRKDVAHRPLVGGPTSTVALAWPVERTTPDVETFIGIVRGRTANSSR